MTGYNTAASASRLAVGVASNAVLPLEYAGGL